MIEALHDVSRPVEVLEAMRGMLAPGGTAIIADEKTADTFTAPADLTERLFYGFSITCCLPAAMTEQPSAGTGTVMRADTLRQYAEAAGFRKAESPRRPRARRAPVLPADAVASHGDGDGADGLGAGDSKRIDAMI